VDIGHRVGLYNGRVKFESNEKYHFIRKTILKTEMIRQPRIYFTMDGEQGDLCFNDLNTPKFKFYYNYCKPNLRKISY